MSNHAVHAFYAGSGRDNGSHIGNMSPDGCFTQGPIIISCIFTHRWRIDYHLNRTIGNQVFYIRAAFSQLVRPFDRDTRRLQQFKCLIRRIDSKIIFGEFLCNCSDIGFISITDGNKYSSFQRQCSPCCFFCLIERFT